MCDSASKADGTPSPALRPPWQRDCYGERFTVLTISPWSECTRKVGLPTRLAPWAVDSQRQQNWPTGILPTLARGRSSWFCANGEEFKNLSLVREPLKGPWFTNLKSNSSLLVKTSDWSKASWERGTLIWSGCIQVLFYASRKLIQRRQCLLKIHYKTVKSPGQSSHLAGGEPVCCSVTLRPVY